MTTETTETLPALTAEDFEGNYPDVTDLPMTGGEDGEHYGWGHIDPGQFAAAANAIDLHLGIVSEPVPEDETWDPGDVQHRWAVTSYWNDGEWQAKWVPEGTPGAWPITILAP